MENYEKAEQDYMAGMKYKEIAEKNDIDGIGERVHTK